MSLIQADNTWALWAIMISIAAISITLEQTYRWASKITGAILALVGMMALANLKIIPTDAPAYDAVWGYVVPLAIPLLLFQCNIKKIGRESGRLLIIYLVSSMATAIGAVTASFVLGEHIPELQAMAAMFTGSYIGGSVNFAAMASQYTADATLTSAAVVADNLLMVLYFFALIAIPSIGFIRKHFRHPLIDEVEQGQGVDTNAAAAHWKAKEISLRDIAQCFAYTTVIVWISTEIATFLGGAIPSNNGLMMVINTLFSNKYLIMTTVTMLLATYLPQLFGKLAGANELGTFLIYIFLAVIGAPASIPAILNNSPILLLFALLIVLINMGITFTFGKLMKFPLEDCIIASNANIGGPTTAAAMAISKGWGSMVGPAMLVGVLGYVIGNYLGIIVASIVV